MIFPLLILILFAVIQFGLVFKNYVTVTDAARVGARTGAVSRTMADPIGLATSAARASAASLDQSQLDIVVSGSFVRNSDVTVTASYPYDISLLGLTITTGNLSAVTTERVE